MAKANAAKIRHAVKEEHRSQMKKLSKEVKASVQFEFEFEIFYSCIISIFLQIAMW